MTLLDQAVLRHMPPDQRTLGLDATAAADGGDAATEAEGHVRDGPRLSTMVFAKVVESAVIAPSGVEAIGVEGGQAFVIAYEAVRQQVLTGAIELL